MHHWIVLVEFRRSTLLSERPGPAARAGAQSDPAASLRVDSSFGGNPLAPDRSACVAASAQRCQAGHHAENPTGPAWPEGCPRPPSQFGLGARRPRGVVYDDPR